MFLPNVDHENPKNTISSLTQRAVVTVLRMRMRAAAITMGNTQ